MDEEKYQKELFEFEKPKRFLPRLSDFFPKADFERNVILTLTLDRAVFITIGIIMTMVVIYALGVESGKSRSAATETEQQEAVAVTPVVVNAPVVNQAAPVQPARLPLPAKPAPAIKAAALPVVKAQAQPVVSRPAAIINNRAKPYTIVAVTLTRKDTALFEINKLKRQGIDAFIAQKGNYFQVCVGAYSDKTDAQSQKDLKKVRRLYKDAYLKLR
ncbi:MAG: SPOR domain-containing protein [Candidatus Omnitrophota bacterium]